VPIVGDEAALGVNAAEDGVDGFDGGGGVLACLHA
jgi:hypothetical protein